MTVNELISELQNFDGNLEVIRPSSGEYREVVITWLKEVQREPSEECYINYVMLE